MRRRRHLIARLDRLAPPPMYGGVIFFEDIEKGLLPEDIPPGCGGYLLVPRPCLTAEEWIRKYGDV